MLKAIKQIVVLAFQILKFLLLLPFQVIGAIYTAIIRRLRFSITFKTTAVYALMFSVILTVFCTLVAAAFGLFLLYEAKTALEKDGQVVYSYIAAGELPVDRLKCYADIQNSSFAIYDKDGKVAFATDGTARLSALDNQERYQRRVYIDRQENLVINLPPPIGTDWTNLRLYKHLSAEKIYIAQLLVALGSFLVLSTLLMIFVGARTSKKMLRPIADMTRTARSISAGALHTRLAVVDCNDELKDLAETFNEMLSRIQTSYEQQQRFVSDASHELRTPIAVLQGYANLLQRWGKTDKEVLDESVTAIQNEADNMKDLIEKLLFLARADKDTQRLEKTAFSLYELLDEVVRETRLIDSEHNIEASYEQDVTVIGDRGLLKQTLRICVDNSVKYTPAGGEIKLTGKAGDGKLIIVVADTGAGIPAEDLPHIFERFYRCDKSRTRRSGGTGLGLAIARWIVEKHYGSIRAESGLGQGTRIIITLPLENK